MNLNKSHTVKFIVMLFSATILFTSCKTKSHNTNYIKTSNSALTMSENIQDNQQRTSPPIIDPVVEAGIITIDPIQPPTKKYMPISEVDQANKEALQEPQSHALQNSLVVYNYLDNFIYSVYTSPQRVTLIRLDKEEEILGELVSGDTANWIIATASDKTSNIIYIKPVRTNISTNLIINTSARTYHLILKSLESTYMVSVEWRYPMKEMQKQVMRKNILETDISIEKLYFGYEIISRRKAPIWKPVKIFDDGIRTFIQFPNKLVISETPALFLVDENKQSSLVNYRVIEDYYVVDRLLYKAELRLGTKKNGIVKLVRLK